MLEEIKARLAAASKGPWSVVGGDEGYGVDSLDIPITWDDHGGEVFTYENANFIAHTPEDLSALISVIERVQEIHAPSAGHNPECECGIEAGAGKRCVVCFEVYPCATIQALEKL